MPLLNDRGREVLREAFGYWETRRWRVFAAGTLCGAASKLLDC